MDIDENSKCDSNAIYWKMVIRYLAAQGRLAEQFKKIIQPNFMWLGSSIFSKMKVGWLFRHLHKVAWITPIVTVNKLSSTWYVDDVLSMVFCDLTELA